LLLPKHVMDAVLLTEYDNVDEGNEEFAKVIGKYGYSQEQFEKLQEWYNKGKKIKKFELFIGEDEEKEGITYKLLSKDNEQKVNIANLVIIYLLMIYYVNAIMILSQMIFKTGEIITLIGGLCFSIIWMCVVMISYKLINKKEEFTLITKKNK